MGDYRYLVFPAGRQPTTSEARQFHDHAGLLARRVAVGAHRHSGALAIAFSAERFDAARASNAEFDGLVARWLARGCTLEDHLAFVKDPSALRPGLDGPLLPAWSEHAAVRSRSAGKDADLSTKLLAAREAVGRSGLAMQRTLGRFAMFSRLGPIILYGLMGLGTLGLLGSGWYVVQRLSERPGERRQTTIERVARNAFDEPLEPAAEEGAEVHAATGEATVRGAPSR